MLHHQIYTGSFESLEIQLKETIAGLQLHDPLTEVAVLVGSNVLASYLRRRLAEHGRPAANVRFYNFPDLVRRITGEPPQGGSGQWSVGSGQKRTIHLQSAVNHLHDNFNEVTGTQVSYPDAPRLPSLGATVLLESLLEDRDNLPKAYAPLSGYKGFRDALFETFRDLRDADITADELDSAVTSSRRAVNRREQLQNFASLYRRYRNEVSRFRDTDDDFRDAIAKLSLLPETENSPPEVKMAHGGQQGSSIVNPQSIIHNPQSDIRPSGGSPLLVYGIYDATGQQARLLDELGRTRPMIYFIPFVDAPVSEFARPFLDARVTNLCVTPQHLAPRAKNNSLGQLAEKNFGLTRVTAQDNALNPDGSFALVSAPGESRVAIEVVREILRAARDGVISGFHEAAVILRQPESDIPILSEAMRLRKIPYYIHGGEKFFNRPICKAILAMNGIETANFSREAILSAVEFISAVLPEETRAGKWDAENWRTLTCEAESMTDVRAWDSAIRNIMRRAIVTLQQLEQSQEISPEKLKTARERLAGALRLRQNWRKLRSVVANWPAWLSFSEWSNFLRRRFGKLFKNSPDWPYLESVFDEIAGLETLAQPGARNMKYEKCSAVKIRALLDEAVHSLRYPIGRFQRSGVNILSVSAARGLRFPLVVIPGLDEGRFPSRLRQDPLLPDAERSRLGSLPLRGARADEEKLLFDMAARSAEKRLVLMTSRLDESADREKFPSLFFLRAASAASGGRAAPDSFNSENIPGFRSVSLDASAPVGGITAVDEGEIRLRWIMSGRLPVMRALEELALMEPQRLRLPLKYERARRENRLTKYDGLISDPRLVQWIKQKFDSGSGQMSASRFEEYARCPYSFFLKKVIDLRILEDEHGITESMDPLERGTAVHAALESFLKNHAGEGFVSASEERLWVALEEEARRELKKIRPIGMPGLLWEIERDKMLALLRNWLRFEIARADGDMRIARLEQAFGNNSEFPPFRMATGQSNFQFCGRIDRADISSDGKRARLTDYKTGTLPAAITGKNRSLLMGGEKIQLAVYRGALAALDEFAAVESVEAEYLYLQPKDGKIRQSALTPEQTEMAFKDLPRVLSVLASFMENGIFFARTNSAVYPGGNCEYCALQPVCGKDRARLEKWKHADPVIQEFLNLA